jgi:type IV fimbrial biogenesis protein FimT
MSRVAVPGQQGFTLVELMITVAVVAILTAIAVPSFRNLTLTNRLVTTANDYVVALNVARLEAVKRNASTQLCSNVAADNGTDTLGTSCGTDAGAVYTLINGTTAQKVQESSAVISGSLQLNGDVTAVRFNGQGLGYDPTSTSAPYSGDVAKICTTSLSTDNERAVHITAGSIISVETKTSAACDD